MTKRKIQRVMRSSRLTPTEVQRDAEIRRQVAEEFPPAPTASGALSGALSRGLRAAIQSSGRSVYQIAKDANVSQIVISRFLSGERDIRLETADRIAEVLRLKITTG